MAVSEAEIGGNKSDGKKVCAYRVQRLTGPMALYISGLSATGRCPTGHGRMTMRLAIKNSETGKIVEIFRNHVSREYAMGLVEAFSTWRDPVGRRRVKHELVEIDS